MKDSVALKLAWTCASLQSSNLTGKCSREVRREVPIYRSYGLTASVTMIGHSKVGPCESVLEASLFLLNLGPLRRREGGLLCFPSLCHISGEVRTFYF